MNIAEKRKLKQRKKLTLYQRAAKEFDTGYCYVSQIASGTRKAIRGKGKKIKEWMEAELEKERV